MAKLLQVAIALAFFCGVYGGECDTSYTGLLNSTADLANVYYWVYTRANPLVRYILDINDDSSLANSNFDASKPTYVLHPGWMASASSGWVVDGKNTLLEFYDCNVVEVEWGDEVNDVNYPGDIEKMRQIAVQNAQVLDWIIDRSFGVMSKSDIECVGHSLGAHSCGMTSLNMTSPGEMKRITGLDPAGPGFYDLTDRCRLDKSHATFVDIIHSNGCNLAESCFGLDDAIGHIDFYPGGGMHQNGCVVDIAGCSHGRSHDYWVESIAAAQTVTAADDFIGYPCTDMADYEAGLCNTCGSSGCATMGFGVDRSMTGVYALDTAASSPFALGN